MRLIKQIVAVSLLIIGVPLTLLCVTTILDPNTSDEERGNFIAALVLFALPPTALGGYFLWDANKSPTVQRENPASREARLRQIFFVLLEANGGNVTVLQMAKEADITGEEARKYLDQRALEFNATFEAKDNGGIVYHFPL